MSVFNLLTAIEGGETAPWSSFIDLAILLLLRLCKQIEKCGESGKQGDSVEMSEAKARLTLHAFSSSFYRALIFSNK